ncbi:SET domain-containing protein-lysine N-methyltransferase [Amycolatopsis australiensis]|uniref:SET domain-containing protein n=1 Tax=Amycolatopsis australiensis TaxID=546364 RepID=A0A1K1SD74_9PSEU|nr:SET domain-containing protein-lysine N-methyltransferase [Amycolatopsis australiensis]SFW82344.1 SET domain-containing protein [Amycolatopsis australiensis]
MTESIEARRAAVVRSDGEYRLVTNQAVPARTVLFSLEGELTTTPTRYTVQLDADRHVDLPAGCPLEEVLDRYYWRFMNHACEPAAVIRDRAVLSLRPIPAWSEITFHYATTEYDMAEAFPCRCGSVRCDGVIQGFRYLPGERREALRPLLSPYLLAVLDGRLPEPAGVWR